MSWIYFIDVEIGTQLLLEWLEELKTIKSQNPGLLVFSILFNRNFSQITPILNNLKTSKLFRLVWISYEIIRPKEDISHDRVYSPGSRDNAQEVRNSLLGMLLNRSGGDAYKAVQKLSKHPQVRTKRRYLELAKEISERDSERQKWSIEEFNDFNRTYTAPIKTGLQLYNLVQNEIKKINSGLRKEDASIRPLLKLATKEKQVQSWLAYELELRSRGLFHVHREIEVANKKKPDIIISSSSTKNEVVIEMKHLGKGWTLNDLKETLSIQISEQYLFPKNRRFGILVLTLHLPRKKGWQNPKTKKFLKYDKMLQWLNSKAKNIKSNDSGPIEICVLGINSA
jgi:hypothetical protein